MGEEVQARTFSREDRQRYREKVRRGLDVFGRLRQALEKPAQGRLRLEEPVDAEPQDLGQRLIEPERRQKDVRLRRR